MKMMTEAKLREFVERAFDKGVEYGERFHYFDTSASEKEEIVAEILEESSECE